MLTELIKNIKNDEKNEEYFQSLLVEKEIAPKTVLLKEGEVASHIHFIKKGCLRMWFNKEGKDITTQFFFEGQAVASIDSFMTGQPSLYTLESIESVIIVSIGKEKFKELSEMYPESKNTFNNFIFQRFRNYAQLFLSRIKDTPAERYEDLVKNHPEIIKRVPQHYIASYLGITAVSLSRIRNKKQ